MASEEEDKLPSLPLGVPARVSICNGVYTCYRRTHLSKRVLKNGVSGYYDLYVLWQTIRLWREGRRGRGREEMKERDGKGGKGEGEEERKGREGRGRGEGEGREGREGGGGRRGEVKGGKGGGKGGRVKCLK